MALFFFLAAISIYAQDRGRISVYIPTPTGGTLAQRSYFQENFRMELIGANYQAAETMEEAMYTLILTIFDNPEFDQRQPMDDNNVGYLLDIMLERNEDNTEIVHFTFPFSNTEIMANWNLYLLYQALSNAYIPKDNAPLPPPPPPVVPDVRWRDKRLYLNLGEGLDIGMFIQNSNEIRMANLLPFPLIGGEFQIWDGFSVEADFKLRMVGIEDEFILSPSIAMLAKGIFKPLDDNLVELYAGAEYGLNIGERPLWLSVLGGAQLGMRGGRLSGGWTMLDAGVTWGPLDSLVLADGGTYNMLRIHILFGWKVGFGELSKKERL